MNSSQELLATESRRLAEWERLLEKLIRAKGGKVAPAEFHQAVNIIYHDVEAGSYDSVHREMWESLPPIFSKLVEDAERTGFDIADGMLADVGCGTGLATELLLRTSMRPRITSLTMVDTSEEMLNRCRERSADWKLPAEFVHGQIESLPSCSVDVLLTSSVLHHIPDLVGFCQHIARIVRPGGLYLHIQDTRNQAMETAEAAHRASTLRIVRRRNRARRLSLPSRIVESILQRVRRIQGDEMGEDFAYIDEVNRRLIASKLIEKPMTAREIWSVTDLRLGDLPYVAIDGVDIDELALALGPFERIAVRTYGFFGIMPSMLPSELAPEEHRLFDEWNEDGAFLSGIWRRRIH